MSCAVVAYHIPEFTHDKSVNVESSCTTHRPDFVFDCKTHFVVLEVDENQHRQGPGRRQRYAPECERIRESNITFNLGLPTLFIRFSPAGGKTKATQVERFKVLSKTLKECISTDITTCQDYDPIFLFYDDSTT